MYGVDHDGSGQELAAPKGKQPYRRGVIRDANVVPPFGGTVRAESRPCAGEHPEDLSGGPLIEGSPTPELDQGTRRTPPRAEQGIVRHRWPGGRSTPPGAPASRAPRGQDSRGERTGTTGFGLASELGDTLQITGRQVERFDRCKISEVGGQLLIGPAERQRDLGQAHPDQPLDAIAAAPHSHRSYRVQFSSQPAEPTTDLVRICTTSAPWNLCPPDDTTGIRHASRTTPDRWRRRPSTI